MGLIRAGLGVVRAAAKGGSATDIGVAAAKGMLPRKLGKVVDKVATPENISRVQKGVRDVVDSGRSGTFSSAPDPWGDSSLPQPPAPGKSSLPKPPPPPPVKDPWA